MNGQERRIRECLELVKGKPLVKEAIQEHYTEGPEIARYYSTSIVNFAMRVFLNEEEEFYQDANDALMENAHYYRTHKIVRDDRDSYYWQLGEEARIILHYGRYGDRKKGLLREDAEMEMLRMMAEYNFDNCNLDYFEYRKSRTWKIHESENHHLMRGCAYWLQAKIMLMYPEFGDMICADGHYTSEHKKAAEDYIKVWMCERGKKCLFVECASAVYTYASVKNLYHFYDFAEDKEMKRIAGSLIDLYYATVAQEQFFGNRGGGQCRVYPWYHVLGFSYGDLYHYTALGVGRPNMPLENDYTVLDSSYRCPELIQMLAQSPKQRGAYEIYSRPTARADEENRFPLYSAEKGWGGVVRYSYCTPDYILGTFHYHQMPNYKWMEINSQNRIQTAIFASDKDARLVFWPLPNAENVKYEIWKGCASNHWVSAQKEGCLMTMSMPEEYAHRGGLPMSVWVTGAGNLADHLEEIGGWIFTYSGDGYAAMYLQDGYEVKKDYRERYYNGDWHEHTGARITGRNADSVLVVEMGDFATYGSLENFREAVLNNPAPIEKDGALYYRSLQGHNFVFGKEKDRVSTIDGMDPAAEIPESYKSPFLNGNWGHPEVTFSYGGQKILWNFSCQEE